MSVLNLGILAHVDAGKTTLTERLLHAAGVIGEPGRVDDGTTQTDSLELERRRGITIRAAVVAFQVGDVTVNLIDTPGHPDFIAEVDRALGVLDGAVLVVSAVEGVQPQTLVLWRALRRLGIPTLIFVNKIDRSGADQTRVLTAISERLSDLVVPLGRVEGAGTREARSVPGSFADPATRATVLAALAEHDDRWLTAFVADDPWPTPQTGPRPTGLAAPDAVLEALAEQSAATQLFGLIFGSAATGAGVADLMASLVRFLPGSPGPGAGSRQGHRPIDGGAAELFAGRVFSVTMSPGADQAVLIRVLSGSLRVRDRVTITASAPRPGESSADLEHAETVTGLKTYRQGGAVPVGVVVAGEIAVVSGLAGARVGDGLGVAAPIRPAGLFAPPTLETAVTARDPARSAEVYAALRQLARQDPLINLRQDDRRHELYLSLFGEVQKEVIAQTLALDHGLEIDFRETTTICVERVVGVGEWTERLNDPANPFVCGLGLRIEPGPPGSGCRVRLDVDQRTLPLYVYSSIDLLRTTLTGHLAETLRQGLAGWQVIDPQITVIFSDYAPPSTTAADVRKLAPLVVMAALRQAGTVVCEPIHRFVIDTPTGTTSQILRLIGQHRGTPGAPTTTDRAGRWSKIEGVLPGSEVRRLQQLLPGVSHGDGALESHVDHYAPCPGPTRTRPRSAVNPLDRKGYLRQLAHRP